MRKFIKYSLHTLSLTILAIIALPIAVMLLLYLPPVQNTVKNILTGQASQLLGTTVSIDRLNIEFFNKVNLRGVYIEDHAGDTLIYADRLRVGISLRALVGRPLSLGDVEMEHARFYMKQDADGTSNMRKIIDKLRNPEKKEKKVFSMRIRSVTIRDMSYRMRKLEIPDRRGAVNFADIEVRDANVYAVGLSIDGDSIGMSIGHVSLKEKSGFCVEDLSAGRFVFAQSGQWYDNLYVRTPDSEVSIDRMRFTTGTTQAYSDFINQVPMSASLRNSRVAFRTIGYFAPRLRNWQTVLENVSATLEGTVADMRGEVALARTRDTEIAATYAIQGLPNIDRTRFDVDIDHISTNVADAGFLYSDITGRHVSEAIDQKTRKLGNILLDGHFEGSLKNFRAEGSLATSDGGADFDLSFIPTTGARTAVHGKIAVKGIDLGGLLDAGKLGRTTFNAGLDGYFSRDGFEANTDLDLRSLVFNGYDYNNVTMNGVLRDRLFSGRIKSGDPNLRFDFDGTLDFNDSIPRYDFAMDLHNADLFTLNFNRRDSVSVVSAKLNATASGTTLDNMNGRVVIDRMLYINTLDSTRTGRVIITGENSARSKRFSMNSDFADLEYRSRTSYREMLSGLRDMLHSYAPTLAPREYDPERKGAGGVSEAGNFSTLNINIKQANNVASIFLPGLRIAENSKLSFTFNPNTRYVTLKASSQFMEWRDNYIESMTVDVANRGDSIAMYVGATDLYAAGIRAPKFSVNGGLRDNRVNVQAGSSNAERAYSALLGVAAELRRDTLSGRPQAIVRFLPSRIISNEKMWSVFGRNIVIDSTMIDIGSFRITGPDQSLRIHGRAGRTKADTVHMDLRKFELEPLTQITSRMGYNVRGIATGHIDLVSALRESMLHARIEFDSVRVNHAELPPGLFESRWDFDNNRAGMMLTGRQSGDTIVRGFFSPKDARYFARINLKDFDMSLIDPMFKGVVCNTRGRASAVVTLRGEKRHPLFNGEIKVPELTTTVSFMNVPYTIRNATVKLTDNVLTLPGAVVRDPHDNRAGFDMKVDLSSLSNVKYNFNVRPRNLLVLDTSESDNEIFYGHVYASGSASITGDKAGVNMNIQATTENNSEFFLPLNDDSSMGVSDIITFVEHKHETADSTDYLFRKRMILERRQKKRNAVAASNMNIAMELNVRPNVEFTMIIDPRTGDMLKGRGTGSLTMNINPRNDEFSMYGDYEITSGIYDFSLQEIIRKRFIIEQGSKIMWTGDPVDALLDVTAVYKLKTSLAPLLGSEPQYRRTVPVECRVMLGETLAQPSITFNVELPGLDPETQAMVANELGTQESMSTQFIMLIAANSFMPRSGAGNVGAAGGTATAFEFLTNQLANIISNDSFDIGIRYMPKNEDTNSSEVTIDFSTQLFSNRLLLEMEGNYDTGDNPNANIYGGRSTSNITGDFYITWLIDPAGHLRAKGFTRTIDRFDENQGMQEHGIGLYYQEDFNTPGDIVRNFRERFKSRKRRQAEEDERRAAMQAELEEQADTVVVTSPPAEKRTGGEPSEAKGGSGEAGGEPAGSGAQTAGDDGE